MWREQRRNTENSQPPLKAEASPAVNLQAAGRLRCSRDLAKLGQLELDPSTFEGTLQKGLEGSLPGEGGHEGENGLKPP